MLSPPTSQHLRKVQEAESSLGLGSWSPGIRRGMVHAMGLVMLVLEGMLIPMGFILLPTGH